MANEPGTDDAVPRPDGFRTKVWLFIGVLAMLAAGGFFFFARTRDMQLAPPRLIGSIYTASAGGADRVYFVTREDRAVTRPYDTEGAYTYEHSYSLYTLHSRAAADGSALAAAQIARIETTSPDFKKYKAYRTLPDGPGILGPQGDVIWLWNNGPQARDLRTLDPVWTADALRARNPGSAGLLPDDPKYARVIGPLDAMVFKATDARYFRIDRATGEFQPVDEPALAALSREHTKTADSAFAGLGPKGQSLRSVSAAGLIVNEVLGDGLWLGLLTADQRATLKERLGYAEEWNLRLGFTTESATSLYGGRYTLDRDANPPRTTIRLDLASVAPVGNARFLVAGFLRRPGDGRAWTVRPPATTPAPGAASPPSSLHAAEAHIVLHRRAIGDRAPWSLTRIDGDGTERWTRDTGLTELDHVSDGGTSIVIAGVTADSGPQSLWPERMVFVDEASGAMTVLSIPSGELTAGE